MSIALERSMKGTIRAATRFQVYHRTRLCDFKALQGVSVFRVPQSQRIPISQLLYHCIGFSVFPTSRSHQCAIATLDLVVV